MHKYSYLINVYLLTLTLLLLACQPQKEKAYSFIPKANDSLWQAYCAAGDTASSRPHCSTWVILTNEKDQFLVERDTVFALYYHRLIDKSFYINTPSGPRWADDVRELKTHN